LKVSEDGIIKKVTWTIDDKDDISKAQSTFIQLTTHGWLAFKRNGEYKQILEFKPEHGELLFMPSIEGGAVEISPNQYSLGLEQDRLKQGLKINTSQ
jgi:hypothetical protein